MFRDDLDEAIVCSDYSKVTEDVNLLDKLLRVYHEHLSDDHWFRSYELHSFTRSYQYAIASLLDVNESKYFDLYIKSLMNVYYVYNDEKIYSDIWQDVSKQFMTRISTIDIAIIYSSKSLFDLRHEMYNNIKETEDTWENVTDFLPQLYDALRANVQYQNSTAIAKQRFWQIFTIYQTDFSNMTETRFLTKPRSLELNKLLKQLIDNHDYEVFSVVFPINFAEYIHINLATMARVYEVIYEQGFQKDIYNNYKQIFIKNGHEFYMHYKARDIADLQESCIELIKCLRCDNNSSFDRPFYLHFLPQYQSEFLFYYILIHINKLTESEMNETVIKFFQGNIDNLYRCFYFSGDSKLFNIRFNIFLDLTLGYWDLSDRDIIKKAYDFCTVFFKSEIDVVSEM